jgi:hypothetical protein
MDPAAHASPRPSTTGRPPGEPYCSNCGYSLAGATESAVCPECGRPLVEVLTRAPLALRVRSKRYRSEAVLFGWPILSIAFGPDPDKGEMKGLARGVIAIGDAAIGGIAIGGASLGVISVGGMSVGLCSIGGCSIGVLAAIGGAAIGMGASVGGATIGSLASGGAAIGIAAQGGGAVGYYASGGGAFGAHTITPRAADPEAQDAFKSLSWFFGAPSPVPNLVQPALMTASVACISALLILVPAAIAHARHKGRTKDAAAGWGPRA